MRRQSPWLLVLLLAGLLLPELPSLSADGETRLQGLASVGADFGADDPTDTDDDASFDRIQSQATVSAARWLPSHRNENAFRADVWRLPPSRGPPLILT